jgi:hypothetical protein
MSFAKHAVLAAALTLTLSLPAFGQDDDEDEGPFSSSTFEGLSFRNIGPAFMSGRIADVAMHPEDPSTW